MFIRMVEITEYSEAAFPTPSAHANNILRLTIDLLCIWPTPQDSQQ
jgi:hypothetical protein